jgi:hypothetical protein
LPEGNISKITVSIIEITKETGDITAVVTVDDYSKVKTFKIRYRKIVC